MDKEKLLALVKEKVSDQGNQGATNLAEVLYAIIESAGGGGNGSIPATSEIPATGFKPGIIYNFDINPRSLEGFDGTIVLDKSELNKGTEGLWHFFMGCSTGLPTWPEDIHYFVYNGESTTTSPELEEGGSYEVSILGGVCYITLLEGAGS